MSMKTIRVYVFAAIASIVGVIGLTATSLAQTPPQQTSPRISVSQMVSKLEKAGYTIHDIDNKYYGWEVEVIDRNRQPLELHVDTQGNITHQEYDD